MEENARSEKLPKAREIKMTREDALEYQSLAFEKIPANFAGKLLEVSVFDIVVSLNGFHAFPDKGAAYKETFRVLKPGGIFTGCFYVKNANTHTDKIIRRFYIKAGFFTPPFETVDSLQNRLSAMYSEAMVRNVESIAVFQCRK